MTNIMSTDAGNDGSDFLSGQPYTLTVLNQNSAYQQFALFQKLPKIIGPSLDPLSLAWILGAAAPGTSDNPSQSLFSWLINYAAVAGYVQDQGTALEPRRFATSTSTAVQISKSNKLPATYMGIYPRGVPAFSAAPTDGDKGLVQVQADNTIPNAIQQSTKRMSLNVGLSMDKKASVVVQLLPNITYQFTPKPSYYILAGNFLEGEIIDTATSTTAFEVRYLDGVTSRTIAFTEQNNFVDAD